MGELVTQQAYRFALAPTPTVARQLSSHAGAARYAYNWGVATIAAALDAYAAAKQAGETELPKVPKHFDLCKQWTQYKDSHVDTPDDRGRTTEWVPNNSIATYQSALRDAAGAWAIFFDSRAGRRKGRRAGRPRFKAKGKARDSFQLHGGGLHMVDGSHINLPKIGTVKIPGKVRVGTWTDRNARTARRLTRLLRKADTTGPVTCPTCDGAGTTPATNPDKPDPRCKTCRGNTTIPAARIVRATITRGASGTWWCSVTVERVRTVPDRPTRRQRTAGAAGIDLGVRHLITTSDGDTYENSQYLERQQHALRVAQQHLARTQPGSNRREKARRRVGTLHEQVALMRHDATNRATTELARQYELLVAEDWNAQTLASIGSKDLPRWLRRRRNRALADAAPGMIRWQLTYKTSWNGSAFRLEPSHDTGRTCHRCGQAKAKPVPPGHDEFRCGSCGWSGDRRWNTAKLLAHRGRKDTGAATAPDKPRGEDVRPGTSGGGRSPMKRDTRTRPSAATSTRRGQPGTPDP